MKKVVYLSHSLNSETIGFGGKKSFQIEKLSSICCGNSNNSSNWRFDNHIGTHIDAPKHFFEMGKSISDFSADFWIFERVCLIDQPVCQEQFIIEAGQWLNAIPMNCEFILFRTGFEKIRQQQKYWEDNPAFSPEIAIWLKKNRKQVRVFGIDSISLSGFKQRELGRKAHQAFLCEDNSTNENPILIMEDMKLSELEVAPDKVIVLPLLVENADGSPVTVIGEYV